VSLPVSKAVDVTIAPSIVFVAGYRSHTYVPRVEDFDGGSRTTRSRGRRTNLVGHDLSRAARRAKRQVVKPLRGERRKKMARRRR
jgi:hypothetical protein